MPLTTTPPTPRVIEALRGDRTTRPRIDTTSSAGLRATLEDGIYEIFGGSGPHPPLTLRASSLRQPPATTYVSDSPLGKIRGVLVMQVLRLLAAGYVAERPFDDALATWRSEAGDGELASQFERLDADEHARLTTDVDAHARTLIDALGEIPSRWMPQTAIRAALLCAGGRVILRDVIDLRIGAHATGVASVVLLDVTTSPLGPGAERVMRYHALTETLRTSVVPLRTSVFSTASGELWTSQVDHALLRRSANEVLDALVELAPRS